MTSSPEQTDDPILTTEELRDLIVSSLASQGYEVTSPRLVPPSDLDKSRIRALNSAAVEHRRAAAKKYLAPREDDLLARIAAGSEVEPARIRPKLVEVRRGTADELLFRYVSKHWSIPVSSGYGRRLRLLVVDEYNGKLIGIIGLADPVINLGVRDRWIGWSPAVKNERLHHVMEAFVVGAVPPYADLLCGKLVAMLAASTEVRRSFEDKYCGRESLITKRQLESRLALITTSSALGRSSIYNRLSHRGRKLYVSLGFTEGYGEFHFANGLYEPILRFAKAHCTPTERSDVWGSGFRNRREVIRKVLMELGLTSELVYHGVQREVFAVPLVKGVRGFLQGRRETATPNTRSVATLSKAFQERWLLPRLDSRQSYKTFEPESYRLWPSEGPDGDS